MPGRQLACLLVFMSLLPCLPALADVRAVVVGISDYESSALTLEYASRDAAAFARILTDVCGVQSSSISLLRDRAASRTAIEGELWRASALLGPDDLFVFYFSGHGTRIEDFSAASDETDGYDEALVAWDGSPSQPGGFILDDFLGYYLAQVRARYALLFIDACFSGGQGKSVLLPGPAPKAAGETFADLFSSEAGSRGRILLAASESDRPAYEDSELQGGRFTHFLLDGIADLHADLDQDRSVSIDELADYVMRKLSAWTGERGTLQTPAYVNPGRLKVSVVPLRRPPTLGLAPEMLELKHPETQAEITVWSPDGRSLDYSLSPMASWLSVLEPTGTVQGSERRSITVRVTPARTWTERQEDSIRIRVSGGSEDRYLRVAYDPEAAPRLALEPEHLAFEFRQEGERQTFRIANVGGGLLQFQVEAAPEWLDLAPAEGSLPGGEREEVTLRLISSLLPAGPAPASLRLRVTGEGMESETLTVPVTLAFAPGGSRVGVTLSVSAALGETLGMADSFGPLALIPSAGYRWSVGGVSFSILPPTYSPRWSVYLDGFVDVLQTRQLETAISLATLSDTWDLTLLGGVHFSWWPTQTVSVGGEIGVALALAGDWTLTYVNGQITGRTLRSLGVKRLSPFVLLRASFLFPQR